MKSNRIAQSQLSFLASVALALLVGVTGSLLLGVPAANAQRAGAPKTAAEDSQAPIARRVLAGIDAARLARIKDAKVKDAAQRTYNAIKAVADNTAPTREEALLASVDQAVASLELAVPKSNPVAVSFVDCKNNKEKCQADCGAAGKKHCGCKLMAAGCHLKALFGHFD